MHILLADYDSEHHTGMDPLQIAGDIHDWTGGYPFLVSRICQILDIELTRHEPLRFQNLKSSWTREGVSEAARMIKLEKNTLFDSLMGKVYNDSALRDILWRILFGGEHILYNPDSIPYMERRFMRTFLL